MRREREPEAGREAEDGKQKEKRGWSSKKAVGRTQTRGESKGKKELVTAQTKTSP